MVVWFSRITDTSLYVSVTDINPQLGTSGTASRVFLSRDLRLASETGHLHSWEGRRDTQGVSLQLHSSRCCWAERQRSLRQHRLLRFRHCAFVSFPRDSGKAVRGTNENSNSSGHPFVHLGVAEDLSCRKQAYVTSGRKRIQADSRKTRAKWYTIHCAGTLLGSGNPKRNETQPLSSGCLGSRQISVLGLETWHQGERTGWERKGWSVIRKPHLTWMKVTTNPQGRKGHFYQTCIYPCRLLWHK